MGVGSDHVGTGHAEEQPLHGAALLRAAADGELRAQDQGALKRHLAATPADGARLEFDRTLRQAVGRVMGTEAAGAAPAGLRDRVLAAARDAEQSGAGVSPSAASDGAGARSVIHERSVVDEREEREAARAGSHRRAGRRALNGVAFVLFGAAVIYFARMALFPSESSPTSTVLADYLEKNHGQCELEDAVERMPVHDASKVPEVFRGILNTSPSLPQIEDLGFTFMGAGPCKVPGKGDSVHLLFRRVMPDGSEGPTLSLFVQRDTGELGLEEGVTYELKGPDEGAADGKRAHEKLMYMWAADGFVYYIVTECPYSCDSLRKAMHAPEAEKPFGLN